MKRLTLHPACKLFPALNEAELQELADDIEENGLQNPIVLLGNRILDGRNRYRACRLAGVKPRFVEFKGDDALQWVVSQNLFRRHLSSSQRAVIAHDLLPLLAKEAKQRMRKGPKVAKNLATLEANGKASQIAARIAKTNSAYVEFVKAISKASPELIDEIRDGTLSVSDAMDVSKLPKRLRKRVLQQASNTDTKLSRIIRQVELDHRESLSRRDGCDGTHNGRRGNIQIWCGDCISLVEKRLKPRSVDVVVTSPPYNLGIGYEHHDDNLPEEDYLGWLAEVFCAIQRVLKNDGSFFLNVGSTRQKPWTAMQVSQVAGDFFILQNEILWVKSITVDGTSSGHFTPLAGDRYLNHNFEHIYHFTKTGKVKLDRHSIGVAYEHESNLFRNKAAGNRRCAGDVWFIPHETTKDRSSKGFHPSVFPVELPERCIKLHGVKKSLTVLDPFCGTGTSMVAAARLGVKGIGIDIDPAYCREARKRVGV